MLLTVGRPMGVGRLMGVEKPTAVGKLPVVESQVNGGHSKVCFARPPLNLSGECHILQTFE